MRIVHAMFSKGNGGIEQSFLHYHTMLEMQGHEVLNLVHSESEMIPRLPAKTLSTESNLSQWDLMAAFRLRRTIEKYQPSAIISHGRRANILLQRANKERLPHIAVLHRYRFKHLKGIDKVICISKHLKENALRNAIPNTVLTVLPNTVDTSEKKAKPFSMHKPVTVGYLGRFVPEKGVDILIDAVHKLKMQGIACNALLAGDGPEETYLRQRVMNLDLDDHITFTGWITQKTKFFNAIDFLIVPSRFESFGMTILEGFYHGRPVIASKTPGPQELIDNINKGVLFNTGSADALADAIHRLTRREDVIKRVIRGGFEAVDHYTLKSVSAKLDAILTSTIENKLAA